MFWKPTDKAERNKQLISDFNNSSGMSFNFFPSYLNQMFFSAEASGQKLPAVKVNRNKTLFTQPPAPASSTFPLPPTPPSFLPEKQELVQINPWFERPWRMQANQYTHTNKQNTPVGDFHLGSVGRLTVVSFFSFQRVMKLFSLSICCTRASLTCWKHHKNTQRHTKTQPLRNFLITYSALEKN